MPASPSRTAARLRRLRSGSLAEAHALFAPHLAFESRAGPSPAEGLRPAAGERDRLYCGARTFWLFLWQILSGNLSCSETVQSALAWLSLETGQKASANTAAYCKARARLERVALARAAERIAGDLERLAQDDRWRGRRVRLVDGTGLSMPDTPQNQRDFPQSKRQKPGCGFPLLRLVVLFSLASGALVRAAWGSLAVAERTLFRQLWGDLQSGDLLVADRGFCGFADFWMLLQRGVDCLMRNHQRRSAGQRTLKRLGKSDHLVAWRKTGPCPQWLDRAIWAAMPEELTVRQIEVAVEIQGFRTRKIVLVTTLLDARRFPRASFAALYRRRWLAELFLRDIKISIGMDVLKCKTPEMVLKELQMYLIAYNLIRGLMLQAARIHGAEPLHLSFKRTADALRQWAPLIHGVRSRRKAMERLKDSLLYYIARLRLPDRPNRIEPRAIKRRGKNYQWLNKPRREFREIAHRNKYRAGLS